MEGGKNKVEEGAIYMKQTGPTEHTVLIYVEELPRGEFEHTSSTPNPNP